MQPRWCSSSSAAPGEAHRQRAGRDDAVATATVEGNEEQTSTFGLRIAAPHGMMLIMRYPDGHKEAVKERIVREASRALRQHGLAAVSIPELMKQAGLTHGAFYTYFESREELVAAAIRWAAAETAERIFSEDLRVEQTLAKYLSREHVGDPAGGCVLAALGTDGARQPPKVRQAFAEVARGFLRLTEGKVHPRGRRGPPSDQALARAASMVGAVILGRLVHDQALAERILSAARATTNG